MAKAPISLHPLFPAIVAVWFAALLGLGSLILPGVLVERFVGATGIAGLVPAAAPPLGLTARLLIALGAAGIGAGFGLLIARQVARAHAAAPESGTRTMDEPGRRPISAHEELGDEGLGAQGRRPWIAAAEVRPEPASTIASYAAEPMEAPAETADEPLDLLDFADDEFADEWEDPAQPAERQDSWMPEDRSDPSYPDTRPELTGPALTEAAEPADTPGQPEWAVAPLESLGLVQLVQRLGASLERRRARLTASAVPGAVPAAPAEFEAAPADEAAQAMAAYFGRVAGEAPADPAEGPAGHDTFDLPLDAAIDETARPFDPPAAQRFRRDPDPDPAPAYASPADADAALRRALATLQRMSSAG